MQKWRERGEKIDTETDAQRHIHTKERRKGRDRARETDRQTRQEGASQKKTEKHKRGKEGERGKPSERVGVTTPTFRPGL